MQNKVFKSHLYSMILLIFINFYCIHAQQSDTHSPPEIHNASPYPVTVSCREKKAVNRLVKLEYSFSENLSLNSGALLGSPHQQSMNLEVFKNNLFCEFSYETQSWNCMESYIVEPLCLYKNPKVLSKRNKLAGYLDNECPICDEWPHIEKP